MKEIKVRDRGNGFLRIEEWGGGKKPETACYLRAGDIVGVMGTCESENEEPRTMISLRGGMYYTFHTTPGRLFQALEKYLTPNKQ
ncbi:MAG: hypothetical protein HUK20_13120 [Fibrobacter sp.]|nr:hypothetical protein [Fibrobacter sp.]